MSGFYHMTPDFRTRAKELIQVPIILLLIEQIQINIQYIQVELIELLRLKIKETLFQTTLINILIINQIKILLNTQTNILINRIEALAIKDLMKILLIQTGSQFR